MPKMPNRPCTYPRCKKYATSKGRCEDHQRKAWQKKPDYQGYGWQWQKIRKQVLRRDQHLCQQCLREGIYKQGTEVDHIVPKSLGGSDSLDNCECICSYHHAIKTKQEAAQARLGTRA